MRAFITILVFVTAMFCFYHPFWAVIIVAAVAASLAFNGPLRVVTTQEGTYIAFKKQGGFIYGAMEFQGSHLTPYGTVVPGAGSKEHGTRSWLRRWGGWIFFIYPFIEPARYSDYNDPNDGFGTGIYVRLGDITSNPFTSKAETTEPDNGSIGVSVAFTSKMRVVNPQKFLFRSPRNVIKEAVEDRQDGALRAWVFSGDVTHAQSAKGNGAVLWQELGPPDATHPNNLDLLGSFDEARDDWGLEIVPNSIIVKRVDLDEKYQDAKKAKSQQGLIAQGEAARLGDPVELMMEKWVARQMTDNPGKTREKVIASLKRSGEYQRKEAALEALRIKALSGDNFTRFEADITSGGKPMEGDLAGLAALVGGGAALAKMLKGNPGGGGKGSDKPNRKRGENKRTKDMTDDELDAIEKELEKDAD